MDNCLTYALDAWSSNPALSIHYDGDHVIVHDSHHFFDTKGRYYPSQRFLPLLDYGYQHISSSFSLSPHYLKLLSKYFSTHGLYTY